MTMSIHEYGSTWSNIDRGQVNFNEQAFTVLCLASSIVEEEKEDKKFSFI